ncbi:(2Fe-2S)-binding protein [Streptantibioticus rubrisoli]|uniref:(2Fe-2S)-binding protein n=1 Tax=Streptantibioticus rubrisoli TaxID=1387313 RepID=A0ABT1P8J6_9ACTN|nr:(2Fe-2S)-binding protein [Streptantibioticus rubrisoli]MCQ4041131.1 (2Fe-2S)-binding protein [Streptantibioticus rubrisoli]
MTPTPDDDLRQVAAVGPFFGLRTEAAPAGPGGEGYRPLADFYAGRGPDPPLGERLAVVAERLATGEPRVAASLVFQGIAARLWSIAFGSAVLCGRTPSMSPDRLWWHPDRMAPEDLWLPAPEPLPVAASDAARRLAVSVVEDHLVPLHTAVRALCPVSPRLLWGNAGSALAGSLRVLHGWCRTQGRPDQARHALDLAGRMLAAPPLRGTGSLRTPPGDPDPAFTRRSCCLYYRVPGGGLCGDCVLRRR